MYVTDLIYPPLSLSNVIYIYMCIFIFINLPTSDMYMYYNIIIHAYRNPGEDPTDSNGISTRSLLSKPRRAKRSWKLNDVHLP